MPWQSVGQHTFLPTDRDVQVGSFDLAPGQDTVWVRIKQINQPAEWPWSYGILSWRSSSGLELGSTKAYSTQLGEVFRLGVGLPPSDRTGSIWFEPRGFNLGWLKAGFPWELSFEAQAGSGEVNFNPYWGRVNSTLSPATAGDNLFISGDVKVGGTIAAPNINLDASGAATFSGTVQTGNQLLLPAITGTSQEAFSVSRGSGATLDHTAVRINYLYTSSTSPFAITLQNTGAGTSSTMYEINENGDHLIGGPLPASPNISLNANGSATFKGRVDIDNNAAAYGLTVANNGGSNVTVYAQNKSGGGYVWQGHNGSNPTSQITTSGTLQLVNTTIGPISSERRLKENIVPVDSAAAWETIKSVPFYAYNFIGSDASEVIYGPMADEVPDEMRIATDRSDDVGVIHTYDNGMLQARLYTALQAALTRIEALEAEITALNATSHNQ